MREGTSMLSKQLHAHIVEEAKKKLHTRMPMFIEGLKILEASEDTWVIQLDAKLRWIDDGMQAHNMIDDLLKSKNVKRAKDGSAYAVIPFEHGPKGATQMTPAQANLLDTIKGELKKRKIPYAKIEKDDAGNAKIGKLHSFNIMSQPIKSFNGPGQGKGPIGQVKQGPTGIPLLQGVSIYQKEHTDKKTGKTGVKRSIMTFRVVSSKMKAEGGRWDHPGLAPVHIFEEAYQWALKQIENEIGPQVIGKIVASLS